MLGDDLGKRSEMPSTISGGVRWEATVEATTPADVRFYVDGAQLGARENYPPYCANGDAACAVDTTELTDPRLQVEARDAAGTVIAASTANATVQNGASSPAPASAPAASPGEHRRPVDCRRVDDLRGRSLGGDRVRACRGVQRALLR